MNYHLVVLVHGLWGNPAHFDYIVQQLEERNYDDNDKGEKLVIYRAQGNQGYKTLDGIDVCGLRVAHEIRAEVDSLNRDGNVVTKMSVIGYSLGGLISRYAIGILHHQHLFDSIEPVNFTTFCTPHVGVLTPGSNISVKIFNNLIPSLLSLSGKQMFLKDETPGNNGALLALMANKNSVFYKALQAFKYKSLYANAINDKRTSWWTAGISIVDPFMKINEKSKLDELNFKYIDTYEPIVIDAEAKYIISNKVVPQEVVSAQDKERDVPESNFWERKWNWVVVASNLLFFAPLWVFWFIISGILESIKSHRRINVALKDNYSMFSSLSQIHLSDPINLSDQISVDALSDDGYDDVLSETGSIKSVVEELVDYNNIEQSLHDRADTLMESVWDAMTSKNALENAQLAKYDLTAISSNDVASTDVVVPSKDEKEFVDGAVQDQEDTSTEEIIQANINELSFFEKTSSKASNEALKMFTLDLSPDQVEIVKNLNELGWRKYPVLIRHTKSTHSAAIVRNINETGLFEGKTVIKHWLDCVFQLE